MAHTTGTPEAAAQAGPSGYAAARRALLTEDGRTGQQRRTGLARLTDEWLAGLLGPPRRGVSLVAVGGYGRGELSPRSDLDLLLLHDGRVGPDGIAAVADRIWYPVWDLGIALDHSVRTVAEARETADDDLKVQLGLLDARHLAGDAELTAGLRTGVLAQWRSRAPERLPELMEMTAERGRSQGELRFLLEPDLKEARGGLRDATALRAVAASWVADAPREGLAQAHRTLLDVRDTLHLATGRAGDRLALQDQEQVAEGLGLPDSDVLLRQVYEAARVVSYASDVTWREVGRVLRARGPRPRPRGPRAGGSAAASRAAGGPQQAGRTPQERSPLAEGVVEHDGEAALARTARPGRDPVLPLRAGAAAAQAGLPLALPAVRRLARAAAEPGAAALPVPWPSEAREEFVRLLGAGEATVPAWEALEAEGLITGLLPEWERVRCRPQRNPVHRYTVDRHLVETAVRASALTRRVQRPDLLLTAALLHDIGKGRPGDHAVVGETIAWETATRIGFGSGDAETVAALVRHHLLLVETATRRDLDDPQTIRSVAATVGDVARLELLHALTEADALATGPAAWSAWRATLVTDLVERVGAVLAGEAAEELTEPFVPTADAERMAAEAWRTRRPVLALRTDGPGDDAGRRAPVTDEEAGSPQSVEPVGVELLVAVPDRPGVLPAVAGVLALHRLTVRAADVRALPLPGSVPPDGGSSAAEPSVLLLTWRIAADYGSLPLAARLRTDLVRALDGSLDVAARLAEREAAHRRRSRRGGAPAPPPGVTVVAGSSRVATVLEVRAQDAPGLLHRIAQALDAARVVVRSAHVSTFGANAVDAFYLTDGNGVPLPSAEASDLARRLESVLAPDRVRPVASMADTLGGRPPT